MIEYVDQSFNINLPIDDEYFLSEFKLVDLNDIVLQLNDLWIHHCTLSIPHPYTEENGRDFISKSILKDLASLSELKFLHLAIRNGQRRLIGCLGFDGVLRGHRAELGYLIGREYRGRGIITRAIAVACGFAFKTWDLVKVTAQVFEFNHASVKVLESNGFQKEGVLRNHAKKNGNFIDSIQFGLLKEEFTTPEPVRG